MRAPLKVLGIYREEKFSNRAVHADKAIMDEVLNSLRKKLPGAVAITVIRPEHISLNALDFNFDLVFSMAQDEAILKALDHLEERGTVVVNSARSIRNCYRGKLSELLSDEAFSYPRYIPLKVGHTPQLTQEVFDSESGYWVKRGDYHALVDDDVVHVESLDHLSGVISNFKNRGVAEVILQENCEGELFKFYGVRDSFFNLRYMGRTSKDRYNFFPGDSDISFDRAQLENLVHKAARILDLDFFGGDCIVTPSGKMHFIDFNDWPSFRTCTKEVAPTIVSYALKKLNDEAINVSSINQ